MSDGPAFPPDANNPLCATEDFPGDQGVSLALPDAAFWTRHGAETPCASPLPREWGMSCSTGHTR